MEGAGAAGGEVVRGEGKELWERVLRLCGVYPQIGVGPGGNVHPAWKKTLKIRTQTVLKCAQQPIMPPFRPCQI